MRLFIPIVAVAPEGWLVVATVVAAAGLCRLEDALLASWVLLALVPVLLFFFLDRARSVPSRPRGVLAPVDGTVVYRRECHDPVLEREAIRIGIRVSFWGAYSLRSPLEGEIEASPATAADAPASVVRTDEGEQLVLRAGPGLLGSAPIWVAVGDRVGQGRRCGLRRLVRNIDVYLPASARVEVTIGTRVRCGQTLIATILRKT